MPTATAKPRGRPPVFRQAVEAVLRRARVPLGIEDIAARATTEAGRYTSRQTVEYHLRKWVESGAVQAIGGGFQWVQ